MEDEIEPTAHQREVHDTTVGRAHNECPQCFSNGGQYLSIENPGEDWTQTYCAYCREYINLDDYYEKEKQRRSSRGGPRLLGKDWS